MKYLIVICSSKLKYHYDKLLYACDVSQLDKQAIEKVYASKELYVFWNTDNYFAYTGIKK